MAQVYLTEPRAGYLVYRGEIDAAVAEVLDSGWYLIGRQLEQFEQEFASYLGMKCAVGASSGTDALVLALRACEVGPGDAVFTVSHTAVGTVAAIRLAGATPVLVEINENTYTMDPERLEEAIRTVRHLRPRAVVPVHLYGHPADIETVNDVAERHGLFVIEDCAQAHGATWKGRKVGTFGHAAAFSFYPTKNLPAIGDGGAVATNNTALDARMRRLRQYGWNEQRVSQEEGINSRLAEIQAAVLRVRLRHLEEDNARRRAAAEVYRRCLNGTRLKLPVEVPGAIHVYHLFVVRTEMRDALRSFLSSGGVGTGVHYQVPVHLQPGYASHVRVAGAMDITERVANEVLSLPMYPQLSEEAVAMVCRGIGVWEERRRSGR